MLAGFFLLLLRWHYTYLLKNTKYLLTYYLFICTQHVLHIMFEHSILKGSSKLSFAFDCVVTLSIFEQSLSIEHRDKTIIPLEQHQPIMWHSYCGPDFICFGGFLCIHTFKAIYPTIQSLSGMPA